MSPRFQRFRCKGPEEFTVGNLLLHMIPDKKGMNERDRHNFEVSAESAVQNSPGRGRAAAEALGQ
jgi:hypothetical protein